MGDEREFRNELKNAQEKCCTSRSCPRGKINNRINPFQKNDREHLRINALQICRKVGADSSCARVQLHGSLNEASGEHAALTELSLGPRSMLDDVLGRDIADVLARNRALVNEQFLQNAGWAFDTL